MPPNNSVVKGSCIIGGFTILGYLAGGQFGSMLGAVIGSVVNSFLYEEPTNVIQEYPRSHQYDEYDNTLPYYGRNAEAVPNNSRITITKRRKTKTTKKDASIKPSSCAICLEEFKPYTVLLPCGHMCFCEECLYDVRKNEVSSCPMCRRVIKEFKDVYSS